MSSAYFENGYTTGYEARRLHTNDMEIGVTDAVQRHIQRDVVAPSLQSQCPKGSWISNIVGLVGKILTSISFLKSPLTYFLYPESKSPKSCV
jgi:hypothetical protein